MEILYDNCIPNVYKELENLFSKEEWKKKYIVLFGMNAPSEIEMEYFYENNIPVQGFVDNNKDKWGFEYLGCKVYSPDELLGEYKENAFIIIASRAFYAMKKQLLEMGYNESQIYALKSFGLESVTPFSKEENYEYQIMDLKDIQQESLEIMKYIREFCDARGIRYFLAFGSLIGAVRHDGFIPWDDDIDVLMPWEDYLRFCNEFSDTEKYELFSKHRKEPKYEICNITFAKIISKNTVTEVFNFPLHTRRCVGVDIFPMNGYPDDEQERKMYELELKNLYMIWNRDVTRRIGSDSFKMTAYNEMWEKLEEAMTRYDYNSSNYVGSVAIDPDNHSVAPKDRYEEPSKIMFEGEMFDAPQDVDYVLRSTFGEYMTLPPEEERNPRHFFHTYRLIEKNIGRKDDK